MLFSVPYFFELNKERPYHEGLCYEIVKVKLQLMGIKLYNKTYPETIQIATG